MYSTEEAGRPTQAGFIWVGTFGHASEWKNRKNYNPLVDEESRTTTNRMD
jgi:hypothetical protein